MDFLTARFLGNSVEAWLTAAVAFIATYLALLGLKKFIAKRLSQYLSQHGVWWGAAVDRFADGTRHIILVVGALYVALQFIALPPKSGAVLDRVMFVAFVIQLIIWANLMFTLWVEHHLEKQLRMDAARTTTLQALFFLVRVLIIAIILLWALDNLGVNITTLVAGLGVGGIAVALAVQNVLGDLLASFTIVLDKPFVLGDFIVLDDYQGTVEHIGIKTTRLRSLGGEQLIFPNANLLQSRIRNFKRMRERRVLFRFNLPYNTPPAQLREIPGIVKEAITSHPKTRFDRCHFVGFGDSSLTVETVYFVLSPDYIDYMDIQQAVNIQLIERFSRENIKFASPSPPIVLQQAPVTASPIG